MTQHIVRMTFDLMGDINTIFMNVDDEPVAELTPTGAPSDEGDRGMVKLAFYPQAKFKSGKDAIIRRNFDGRIYKSIFAAQEQFVAACGDTHAVYTGDDDDE